MLSDTLYQNNKTTFYSSKDYIYTIMTIASLHAQTIQNAAQDIQDFWREIKFTLIMSRTRLSCLKSSPDLYMKQILF